MDILIVKKHSIFLKWWWFFSLLIVTTIGLFVFDVHNTLWENDKTKLSFLILSIFYGMTIHCGYESWLLSKLVNGEIDKIHRNVEEIREKLLLK